MVCNWFQRNIVRSSLNQRCMNVWCQVAWVTSFYGGALCLWVLSAELASHLLSGTQNFGTDPRLMENLYTPGVNIYFERNTSFLWHFFSFDYWCINCFDVCFIKWLVISEKGVKEDVEGNGHGWVWPTIPAFAWLDCRNSQNMSVRIASIWAEIWNTNHIAVPLTVILVLCIQY